MKSVGHHNQVRLLIDALSLGVKFFVGFSFFGHSSLAVMPAANTCVTERNDESFSIFVCRGANGLTRTTKNKVNDTEVIDRLNEDGSILDAGKYDPKSFTNTDYKWDRSEDYKANDKDCKTGAMIDGKYSCTGASASLKSAQAVETGSQMIGAGVINHLGIQQQNEVIASGGDMGVAYEAQSKLMERAGKTQQLMAATSTAAGIQQMAAARTAKKNIEELKRELALVDQRLQIDTKGSMSGDGTNQGEFGYIQGNRGDSRALRQQITGKIIDNFNLNQVAKMNGVVLPSPQERAILKEAGILNADNTYKTQYKDYNARQNAIVNKYKTTPGADNSNNAQLQLSAITALRKLEAADKAIIAKKNQIAQQTKQIIQKAISEQEEAYGKTAQGAAVSTARGLQQFWAGSEQRKTADSIRNLANQIRENGRDAPPIVLGSQVGESSEGYGGRGGGGIGGGGPDVSLVNGNPDPNPSFVPGGFGGMGDPLNTGNFDGEMNGLRPTPFGVGQQPQPPGGGGAAAPGGAGVAFDSPQNPATSAGAGATPNADPFQSYAKGGDYKSPTSANGLSGNTPSGVSPEMMAEMMKNLSREDGAGKATDPSDGRSPASAEIQFLSADTDLFKQVSLAYRGKLESGAVGIVGKQ